MLRYFWEINICFSQIMLLKCVLNFMCILKLREYRTFLPILIAHNNCVYIKIISTATFVRGEGRETR